MNRRQLIDRLNNSGLAQHMDTLQRALVVTALERITGHKLRDEPEPSARERDAWLLHHAGPAAAACAIDFAVRESTGRPEFRDVRFNGSPTHNVKLAMNLDDNAYSAFGGSLQRYLLARDMRQTLGDLVDARHKVDAECGYPAVITPAMYRYMYDYDETGSRVNDIFSDEAFAVDPRIYDDEAEDVTSPFEEDVETLCREKALLSAVYRFDKVRGIGRYGCLLLGLDDGRDLSEPARGIDPVTGLQDPNFTGTQRLVYLRPFDEYLMTVRRFETDQSSPRFQMPTDYGVLFTDGGGQATAPGSVQIQSRLQSVHWTRVVHAPAPDQLDGTWAGMPRQQPVFRRLLDLRKTLGGSAEMFWSGGFPTTVFEIDPKFVADNPEFDDKALADEVQELAAGFKRYFRGLGVTAKLLSPTIHSPDKHVNVYLRQIAMRKGVPLRIFLGSEEAKLASSQDKVTWNRRLSRYWLRSVTPEVLRPTVQRLIDLRCVRPPAGGRFLIDVSDLNVVADEDKSNLALKWTQALSQYVTTGLIHLVEPLDFLTTFIGLTPADAKRIIAQVEKSGGFAKLRAVDPSQARGQVLGQQSGDLPEKRAQGATAQGGGGA